MDVEERTAEMVIDDVEQLREQQPQRFAIVGRFDVAPDGVEEPERCVGRVIQPFVVALGEHIRDQPVADVRGECAQDVAGLAEAAGAEGQAFEADHRVAAPVGESVVAGDDGARLVAGGADAGFVGGAGVRMDEELVGSEDEQGCVWIALLRNRQHLRHALVFRG